MRYFAVSAFLSGVISTATSPTVCSGLCVLLCLYLHKELLLNPCFSKHDGGCRQTFQRWWITYKNAHVSLPYLSKGLFLSCITLTYVLNLTGPDWADGRLSPAIEGRRAHTWFHLVLGPPLGHGLTGSHSSLSSITLCDATHHRAD